MTNVDDALLWAREVLKAVTPHHGSTHAYIDAGHWDELEAVRLRVEAFRAGLAHADAGLLAALEAIDASLAMAMKAATIQPHERNDTRQMLIQFDKVLHQLGCARAAIAAAKGEKA